MKTMISFSAVVILTLCMNVNAWAQASKGSEMDSITETATINLPTIKCGSCVETVTNAINELKGIEKVNVDKKTKMAVVKYNATKLKIADIESAIAKAGYDANDAKRDKKAYEQLDSCCK